MNGWANNGEACDLRRYHAHYNVTVMNIIDMIWIETVKHPWETTNIEARRQRV